MPTAEAVLSWATSVGNEWRGLSIAWHVALGALVVAVSRSGISERLVARLLVLAGAMLLGSLVLAEVVARRAGATDEERKPQREDTGTGTTSMKRAS